MIPVATSVRPERVSPIVWLLVALNLMCFELEVSMSDFKLQRATYLLGVIPARFTHPDWASRVGFPIGAYSSLITSQFLHGGWLHLISNMWTLWLFGRKVEEQLGSLRFLVFYLVCGAISTVVHVLLNPHSIIPAIGASGAIAGVMAAYLFLYPRSQIVVMIPLLIFPLLFDLPAILYLGYWIGLQFLSAALSSITPHPGHGIAFWAHVGGFTGGLMMLPMFLPRLLPRTGCGGK